MMSQTFSCEQIEARASEFIDDELNASERVSFELHTAACHDCRTLIADLSAIRDDAAELPVLVPARDLWAGIESRIQPTVLPFTAAPSVTARPSRWAISRSHVVLGGMAAALIGAVALGRWTASTSPESASSSPTVAPSAMVVRAPVAPVESLSAVESTSAPTVTAGGASVTPVAGAERPTARVTYQREIEALKTVMDEGGEFLDPTTKAIIESSLRTVDSAIAEARAALARDPRSGFLAEQLNKSLERKLGLLRTAALHSSSL